MSRTIRAGRYAVPLLSTNGVEAARAGEPGVHTLANSSTYYIDVGGLSAPLLSIHLQWSAALIGTITFESCNFGDHEVSGISTTLGDWLQENPTTAYVPIVGTGASVLALTITLAGGGAGGAIAHIGNLGAARVRVKAAITTGGALRTAFYGKGVSG